MQGDEKLPSLKTLQAEQAQLFEEQERLYAERNRFKKEAKKIETIKSKVREIETISLRQYRTEKSARYRQVWYNKAMDTRSRVFPRRSSWNLLNIIKLVLGREGECGPFPASAGSKGIAH